MAVSYPKTIEERAKLYLHCMVEIRERLKIVRSLIDWKIQVLFVREMAYLQLRHSCEVLAIACLAAQGDFKTQRAFREEYRPSIIFKALRKQFPAFFPSSTKRTSGDGRHHLEWTPNSGAYTEDQVVALWNHAGDRLHRLSVAKYLKKSFRPEDPAPDDLATHLAGMAKLLECHTVALGDPSLPKNTLLQVETEWEGQVRAIFLHLDKVASTVTVQEWHAELGE